MLLHTTGRDLSVLLSWDHRPNPPRIQSELSGLHFDRWTSVGLIWHRQCQLMAVLIASWILMSPRRCCHLLVSRSFQVLSLHVVSGCANQRLSLMIEAGFWESHGYCNGFGIYRNGHYCLRFWVLARMVSSSHQKVVPLCSPGLSLPLKLQQLLPIASWFSSSSFYPVWLASSKVFHIS